MVTKLGSNKTTRARYAMANSCITETWKTANKINKLLLIGMTREILPMTVPDGDNSSPNVLIRTGGTKSK